ncbi:hypothetical protein PIB30_080494 [Stylosanthes scabra]|uniref:Uncharacterized protein n=1 Tax=Stylosanthes scabra TaxID=79078 RepID=A0ABU6XR80_9FABA|nr:hypothetical protein [Stylosanthes scabra]
MDNKLKEVTLTRKGKEKIRTQPTSTSPRFAAKQRPIFPPSKIRTPSTRDSPRLAILKALPPPSHEIPAVANPGTPKATKIRRTARISAKLIKCRFSQRIIAKGGPSIEALKEKEGETKAESIHNLWGLADFESSSLEVEDIIGDGPCFWPYDGDLSDWRNDDPSDNSAGSCTKSPPANL